MRIDKRCFADSGKKNWKIIRKHSARLLFPDKLSSRMKTSNTVYPDNNTEFTREIGVAMATISWIYCIAAVIKVVNSLFGQVYNGHEVVIEQSLQSRRKVALLPVPLY